MRQTGIGDLNLVTEGAPDTMSRKTYLCFDTERGARIARSAFYFERCATKCFRTLPANLS